MISEIKSNKVSLRRKANSFSFQPKNKIVTLNSYETCNKENLKSKIKIFNFLFRKCKIVYKRFKVVFSKVLRM